MVLLKNEGNVLPLDKQKIKTVLVVGPDAYSGEPVGAGSARVLPFAAVSALQGISTLLGPSVNVFYEAGLPSVAAAADETKFVTETKNGKPGLKLESFRNANLSGKPESTQVVHHLNEPGTTWNDLVLDPESLVEFFNAKTKPASKRWTGYFVASQAGPYAVVAQGWGEGGGYRLYVDDKLLFDDWKLSKAFQESSVLQLTAGPHKVVGEEFVDSFVGGRLRVGIIEQSKIVSDAAKQLAAKVDAVIVAAGFDNDSEGEGADRPFSLPFGQDELIREMSAANKNTIVAITSGGNVDVAPWIEHVPGLIEMWYPGEQGGTALAEMLFGVVNPSGHLPATFEKSWQDNPTHGNYYPDAGTVRVAYKEGIFVGYRGYEHNNVKPQLKGFSRMELAAGETKHITIPLDARAFAFYDVAGKHWQADAGTFSILVGDSSADTPLSATVSLPKAISISTQE
jgi:beta-glucosidase